MPIDTRRMAKSLLSDDEKNIVARATMFPIAKHDNDPMSIMMGYGLLGPQQVANADPAYDTKTILDLMKPRPPETPDVDMYDLQLQHEDDEKNNPEPDFPPIMRKRLIPLRDKW